MSNRTRLAAAAALTLVITAAGSGPAFADHGGGSHHGHKLIDTEMLVPVQGSFVGKAHPVRGLNGGGLPWVISEGEITVRADGRVKMEVEGLVIDPTETANPAFAGINPSPTFTVIVSCLDDKGKVTNITAGTTPATKAGDAEFEGSVSLPMDCMSPIAFVTNAGGAWFAHT
jgi:hypothetical protein